MVGFDRAGKRPLEIGSNKTVIGVGLSATIKGKGLRLNGVSNVVIRNLTISDINQGVIFAGDAIAIARADLVRIDHNRFHNIGRQMIAGGFGPTTNITIPGTTSMAAIPIPPIVTGSTIGISCFLVSRRRSPSQITISMRSQGGRRTLTERRLLFISLAITSATRMRNRAADSSMQWMLDHLCKY
ncbi:hypothetical protein IVA87_07300 [Bradyrhizobium sp. 147]|uniref:pectate lyase family protein n=1 Tax=unclassified Bradyrhizobium TaxID=2631580 RepID=UPI001FFA4EF1|nr:MULTISPECIES: hypothetical protein [unclassified Bradyrhizobium]MCK1594134.1 hypothetical protein [Bradyrhizobium sp. 164]MCK1618538.1 hypothetical protein [Bradyrhizobium sp. 159]MCK1679279.1 hypothetical protein [Bradyrhizobium sp. 147]